MKKNNGLWEQAVELSARQYSILWEIHTLSTGETVHMLRHPELPGCKAQGKSIEEARANLADARIDYIYVLLEMGLPIPSPANYPITSSPNTASSAIVEIYVFDASLGRQGER